MKTQYLTSGQLIAKYPDLRNNLITARDLGCLVRLEVEGYYNSTLGRVVILETEVKEILKFIKQGLARKKNKTRNEEEKHYRPEPISYLTSEEIMEKYPVLFRYKVRSSDLFMFARLQAIDSHFDSTIKKLVILETEVNHIITFIKKSIERKILRRFNMN